MLPASPAPRPIVRILAASLALVVVLGVAATEPAPAAASGLTPEAAQASLLEWTNRDRAAIGLRPLRSDPALVVVAAGRAANLAASHTFSHKAAGGDLSATLSVAGIQWYAWGENIGTWPGAVGSATVAAIYRAWRESPDHWALLMSPTMNYVGFGVTGRAPGVETLASAVLTESRDHTAPGAKIDRVVRDGTTITFTWHGYDAPLQTHWAGLRDYDAWYRVDGGAWRLVRNNTTTTSLRLTSRAGGHRYWLKVQARDGAGNVGRTSAPVSVWVP